MAVPLCFLKGNFYSEKQENYIFYNTNNITICAISTVLLMFGSNGSAIDVVYEAVSSNATVGLSRNFTATLDAFGKWLMIAAMYFGRVGPISLAIALGSKSEAQNLISEPTEDISIG